MLRWATMLYTVFPILMLFDVGSLGNEAWLVPEMIPLSSSICNMHGASAVPHSNAYIPLLSIQYS